MNNLFSNMLFPSSKKCTCKEVEKMFVFRCVKFNCRQQNRNNNIRNGAIRVYDTSGPYTDPLFEPNIHKGLPTLREEWIVERGDVEKYEGRFPNANLPFQRKPMRAKKGKRLHKCTMQNEGSLHLKWSLSQFANKWIPNLFVKRWRQEEQLSQLILTTLKVNR